MIPVYDLHSQFDIEKHKATFINYLEVIIDADGIVHYAVPSHQEYLIMQGMLQSGLDRQDFYNLCPPDMYCDYMQWLCDYTHSIAVWNNYYIGTPNPLQCDALNSLQAAGLFRPVTPRMP